MLHGTGLFWSMLFFPGVEAWCAQYKNMHMTLLQVILHETIDGVLRRGEKLDALVDKSNDLSLASQMFYKQAKKTNSCCQFM